MSSFDAILGRRRISSSILGGAAWKLLARFGTRPCNRIDRLQRVTLETGTTRRWETGARTRDDGIDVDRLP
jgi:hypothetical protein